MSRHVLLSFALVLAIAPGCGSKRQPTPAATSDGGATAPGPAASRSLLIHVPTTTPYVVQLTQGQLGMFSGSSESVELIQSIVSGLAAELLDPEAPPPSDAPTRLRAALARELMPFDDTALARVGWQAGRSEAVLYGEGLVPVLRVRLDGDTARAALRRAITRAQVTVTEGEQAGVPYVRLPPLAPDQLPVVIAFHRDQVALAFTLAPDEVLPHLASLAPALPSIATDRGRKPRDPAAPADAWMLFAIDPSRVASALRAGDLRKVVRAPQLDDACVARIAALLDRLPPFANDFWRVGDQVTTSYLLALTPELRAPFEAAPGLPLWLTTPVPGVQLAVGFRPAPVLALLDRLSAELEATRTSCGRPPRAPLALSSALGELAAIESFAVVGDAQDGALHLAGAFVTGDAGPVWTALARLLPVPIGPLPEDRKLRPLPPVNGLPTFLGHAGPILLGGLGSMTWVEHLTETGWTPVPDVLLRARVERALMLRFRNGEAAVLGTVPDRSAPLLRPDEVTDVSVEARLIGSTLVVHHSATMPAR